MESRVKARGVYCRLLLLKLVHALVHTMTPDLFLSLYHQIGNAIMLLSLCRVNIAYSTATHQTVTYAQEDHVKNQSSYMYPLSSTHGNRSHCFSTYIFITFYSQERRHSSRYNHKTPVNV